MQKKGLYAGVVLLGAVIAILTWLFFRIPVIEQQLKENMTEQVIDDLSELVLNIENDMFGHAKNKTVLELVREDSWIQMHFEESLRMLSTSSIRYVYVLYRDEKGMFRFMLDGSAEEKAELGQPFMIENEQWIDAYENGSSNITFEKNSPDLWISYIHPISRNGQTEGMIVLDFSREKHFEMLQLIEPIQQAFVYVFIFITLVVGIVLFQLLQYLFIRKKSITDPLTKLYNRQFLNEIKNRLTISDYQVLMIDIDHFKQLNDMYGHQVGDTVLQKVAETFSRAIRKDDYLVRYGGEEFLLLLHNPADSEKNAFAVAERILDDVRNLRIGFQNIAVQTTVSIGIEPFTSRAKSMDEAIRHADEMLYLAKQRGRNRIEVFHESKSLPLRPSSAFEITDIKEAIDEKRLLCHFQPICDGEGDLRRFEALVRIVKHDGTLIYPGAFLPLIQNTNIYTDMTKGVIDYCFDLFKDNMHRFSINLRFSDLLNETVVSMIEVRLQSHENIAERLTIELLEDEQIQDLSVLRTQMSRLKKFGVRFAMDDFGSGYANYGHLMKLEFDCLKIDGELIRHLDDSEYCRNMVESLTHFAHKANIKIIAEFVENKTIFEQAKRFGIDYFQGYHFGKPSSLPISELSA